MLQFSNTNIYSYRPVKQWFAPLAKSTKLMPFQFWLSGRYLVTKVEVINGNNSIDLTNELTVDTYQTDRNINGFFYVYAGGANLTLLTCGVWQLKLTLTKGLVDRIYYSNFFNVVDYDFPYLYVTRTSDLSKRLYSSIGYIDFINYYPTQLKKIINYENIEGQNIGNGIEQLDYQFIAEQYQYFAMVDKFALKFFTQFPINMTIAIDNDAYFGSPQFLIDNPKQTINYIPEFDMYEITWVMKIQPNEITLCQGSFTVSKYLGVVQRTINSDGDVRVVNGSGDLRISTD